MGKPFPTFGEEQSEYCKSSALDLSFWGKVWKEWEMSWTVILKCLREERELFGGEEVRFPAKPFWAQTLVGCMTLWFWTADGVWSPMVEETLLYCITHSVDDNVVGRRTELSTGLLLA